ncbi:MAG TPA: 3-deoxy-D-manno-octulosonic acid transferase [Nitrospira sp.]|nr:3-deoxy-D-manno-octulosonic acid transferase [Nitrospira sp.]
MWKLLYNGLLLLASPVILVLLLVKPRCRRGMPQRFGLTLPALSADQRPLIWMHAVSLGEVVAIAPLVRELQRRHPEHRFAVSTATETGRDAVEQRLAGVAEHLYAPLDFPWAVWRTIDRLRPVLYVFIETELWPNLLDQLARRGVPTVMVNGRLSTKSYARQRRAPVRWLYEGMLRSLRLCLMQSDRDVERIISLGADPRSVQRTGNIKFDQPLPASTERKPTRVELGLTSGVPLLVAGSTHPVEEEVLVDAYRAALARHPSAQLLLAPRHIERADAVEAMVRARGLSVGRRTRGSQPEGTTGAKPQVIILDSRGELASVYQEATVAFVGGTLVPVGGHNLLEPAFWAKPVLFGPYTDHCVEIADLLVQADGGRRVSSVEELTAQLLRLFDNDQERARMGQAAQSMVQQNQGALQATIDAIDRQLAGVGTGPSAPCSPGSLALMAGR